MYFTFQRPTTIPGNLKRTFAQWRNVAFTTGAGVSYPEGVTIIPNESSEARLGLKSIEGLCLKAG